jgi:transcriptional regulator with XRE-family HTH domain
LLVLSAQCISLVRMTDLADQVLTPAQCRAARGLLNWSQGNLAKLSKVARATLAAFEAGMRTPYPRTLEDIKRALEAAGVEFTNGDQPGVRMQGPQTGGMAAEDLNASNDE